MAEINVIYDGIYIDPLVSSVRWSGDIMQACRSLEVSLLNTEDGLKRRFDFQEGKEVLLLKDGKELFRGVLFSQSINAQGAQTLKAYDENVYLTKNTTSVVVRNQRADQVIASLCAEFGIPVGTLADTGYVISKMILRGKTLWDIFVTMLTETTKQNGRRFWVTSREGKLHLLERKTQVTRWVLERGVNILDASYDRSIEEMRTQVRVESSKDSNLVAVVKNDEMIKLYGVMQHYEQVSDDKSAAELVELAKKLLNQLCVIEDTASITALGNEEVIAGSAVYVEEAMTGIVGGFYVSTDAHTFQNGTHTMQLTLTATDDLPQLEYDGKEES